MEFLYSAPTCSGLRCSSVLWYINVQLEYHKLVLLLVLVFFILENEVYELLLRSLMLLLSSWIEFFFITKLLRLACVHLDNSRGISYLPTALPPTSTKTDNKENKLLSPTLSVLNQTYFTYGTNRN